MNSDQLVYNGPAVLTSNATTAHSGVVHAREVQHLNREAAIEGRRVNKEEELAFEDDARANKHFAKATHGHGRRARRHEAKGEQFAAAANAHHLAAMESQAEVNRAATLAGMPVRGTLPTAQVVNATTTTSTLPTTVNTTYLSNAAPPSTAMPLYHSTGF